MEYEVGKRLDSLEDAMLEVHEKLFPERYQKDKEEKSKEDK